MSSGRLSQPGARTPNEDWLVHKLNFLLLNLISPLSRNSERMPENTPTTSSWVAPEQAQRPPAPHRSSPQSAYSYDTAHASGSPRRSASSQSAGYTYSGGLQQRAYFIMAQGLLSMNAWDDALTVLREAVIAFLEHWGFKIWRRQCMKQYLRLEDRLRV